ILFVGQVERGAREREAFQEIDYRAVFGTIAKWVTEVEDPARLPELISRAFHVATAGRPGPVVVALPEDVLTEMAAVPDALPFA
ncbi:thiamine pyrophosphate-binding protein, partial [Klebsiella pneumoniae]